MRPDELVDALGRALAVTGLGLDAQGCCALDFEGNLHLELRCVESAGVIHLCAAVARLPGFGQLGVLRALAAANLSPCDNGCCHFALANGLQDIVLCRALDLDELTLERLLEALRAVLRTVLQWRQQLVGSSVALA
jgi:hypothetical protein